MQRRPHLQGKMIVAVLKACQSLLRHNNNLDVMIEPMCWTWVDTQKLMQVVVRRIKKREVQILLTFQTLLDDLKSTTFEVY